MAQAVEFLCPECGVMLKVADVEALILALHMQNDCDVSPLMAHTHQGGA